ncbi:hypothetical protein [Flindersiella endophytica]
MTMPLDRNTTSRRAALDKARQSRRPSRLGTPAGEAVKPDYIVAEDAGFPGLLERIWREAVAAPDPSSAVSTLLTLGGHVPADVQLRALRLTEEAAMKALFGMTWREEDRPSQPVDAPGVRPAFLGELGLTTSGRIAVRVPSQGPLVSDHKLVDGVIRLPWTPRALSAYRDEVSHASTRFWRSVAECRRWLDAAGQSGRDGLLDQLKEAALRTAPFVIYQEGKQYTNFRDRNTLTGKTLWPGHPDCALSSLQGIPLELWSDNDAVLVVCLGLLVRSAGYARIEEANGTQLTLDHVAHLLERTRRTYNSVPAGQDVPPATSTSVEALSDLAGALRARRQMIGSSVRLYREIHGPLMHKIERLAAPHGEQARRREQSVCAHLRRQLPVAGATLTELADSIAESPSWLSRPHGGFTTGLESAVYETVAAATKAFDADFAMSRGIRSLPQLIRALRANDWEQITRWELPDYFCCVVPAAGARRYFGDSPEQLADVTWAISSRMQYNSWHFIAGSLPKVPVVSARDYFVPPTIPDLAYYSDQHHHGHVAARVRFSIRSPQAVDVLDRTFNGFVDLRLLRCEGPPFDEQDLLAADRCSSFIARATTLAADLIACGETIEVAAFDSQWHWTTIAASETAGTPGRGE